MDKNFPPSELKLDRLRKQGEVPMSRQLLVFSSFLGLAIGLFAIAAFEFGNYMEYSKTMFVFGEGIQGETFKGLESLQSSAFILLKFSFWIAFPLFITHLLGVLLQTKFLFLPGRLGFSFSRVFSGFGDFISGLVSRVIQAFGTTFNLLFWLLVCTFVLKSYFAQISHDGGLLSWYELDKLLGSMFESSPHRVLSADIELQSILGRSKIEIVKFIYIALGYTLLLGVCSRLLVGVSFYKRHSMSRDEVMAEYRESELMPEMKQALNELRERGEE